MRRPQGRAPEATGWRPTDLVHALAQLPDEVTLELESDRADHGALDLLSRAYGVEDRLELRDGAGGRWYFEGASSSPDQAGRGIASASRRTMAEFVESLWPDENGTTNVERDDRCLRGHRIAVVVNNPTHYRVPLFNGIARRAALAGASLRVFFLGKFPTAQPWLSTTEELRFDHEYVDSAALPSWVPLSSAVDRVRPPRLPRGLGRRLQAFGPSMVVAGSFSFFGIAAYRYAARRRVPFGLWSGDVAHQRHNRSYWALRTRQREWLARKADFGIGYGSLAARYLNDLAPGLPSVIGRNTSVVDVTKRRAAASDSGLEILAVADLSVPEKGLEIVVEAMRLLEDRSCRLRVIGNLPPAGALARAAEMDTRIEFLGPLPHDRVKQAYERSDVFVFPSRMDIFGLALLEAMAAGLPAISSSVPGSVADLVIPEQNCMMAAARDPRSWADAIVALARAPELRASLGAAAQTTVRRRWTMAHAVESMTAAFRLGALRAEGGA